MGKMTQEQLRKLALEDMKDGINKVISGEVDTFNSKLVHMADLKSHLEGLGWSSRDDFDTNGWQGDMWESFKMDDKIIEIGAEGYYGGVSVNLGKRD